MRGRCVPAMLLTALMLTGCMRSHPYAAATRPDAPSAYANWNRPEPPRILQYHPDTASAAIPVSATSAQARAQAGRVPSPTARGPEPAYTLDSGDRLRIVVFGQQGLSSTYAVDAGGRIDMPLIGSVPARGLTSSQLAEEIAAKLRRGYMRDPHVSAEIVAYRPFFILGEVNTPGQYPYVAHMTVETAVAIAGGFAPRASKDEVALSRTVDGQTTTFSAPLTFQINPGDTIRVKERWF